MSIDEAKSLLKSLLPGCKIETRQGRLYSTLRLSPCPKYDLPSIWYHLYGETCSRLMRSNELLVYIKRKVGEDIERLAHSRNPQHPPQALILMAFLSELESVEAT